MIETVKATANATLEYIHAGIDFMNALIEDNHDVNLSANYVTCCLIYYSDAHTDLAALIARFDEYPDEVRAMAIYQIRARLHAADFLVNLNTVVLEITEKGPEQQPSFHNQVAPYSASTLHAFGLLQRAWDEHMGVADQTMDQAKAFWANIPTAPTENDV